MQNNNKNKHKKITLSHQKTKLITVNCLKLFFQYYFRLLT
jgi:hypothetical protein